jgi:ADP-ribose pyrophosphatase YjhB (NUDIX family)
MTTIVGYDAQANPVTVDKENLLFCPAAYAVYIENNEVLLLREAETDLFCWPGNTLASGEPPTQAVSRAFHRLTGVIPFVGPLIYTEALYRVDENGRPYHLAALYYLLERPSTSPISLAPITDTLQPEMVAAASVQRSQLQFGRQALQVALQRLKAA